MFDRKSLVRGIMHLAVMLALAALGAYAIHFHLLSEQADHDLEHGPAAQQQLEQALDEYYKKK
jgi:hypothetical protein